MINLKQLVEFLDSFLAVHQFKNDERGGIYLPSQRSIHRLGLALEPGPHLSQWVEHQRLDALFLHRPWKLQPEEWEPNIGVVSYHLPFDERLTLGFNPRLAAVLGMEAYQGFGEKEGRPIGTIGKIEPQSFVNLCDRIHQIFGGCEQTLAGNLDTQVQQVALVGAMTDALVRQAHARGADVYITGQIRQPAIAAVRETGIAAIAVGHQRIEEWGLRALAGVLRERFFSLEVILPEETIQDLEDPVTRLGGLTAFGIYDFLLLHNF